MSKQISLSVGLVSITLLALVARWMHLDYLLPHHPEPDAQIVSYARELRTGVIELPFIRSTYPHFLGRLLAWFPPRVCLQPLDPEHLQEHLQAAASPYLQGRRLCVLLSVLAVPFTGLIARRFLGNFGALLAAGLVATSLLHLNYSQQARPHGPLSGLTALTLWAALRTQERGRLGDWGLLSAILWATLGTLHTAVFLLPAIGLSVWLGGGPRRLAMAALPALAVVLSLLCFWPFLFDRAPTGEWIEGEAYRFPHRLDTGWFDASGFSKNLRFLWDQDPTLAALLAIGLFLWALRRFRLPAGPQFSSLLILIAFALPYWLTIGVFGKTFPRFLLPLLPCLAVLAAWPVERLAKWTWIERRRLGPASLAALCLCFPTSVAGKLVWLRGQPDTWQLAVNELGDLAVDDQMTLVLGPTIALPLIGQVDQRFAELVRATKQNQPWLDYILAMQSKGLPLRGPRLRYLQESGRLDLRLLHSDPTGQAFSKWLFWAGADAICFPAFQDVRMASALANAIGEWSSGSQPFHIFGERHQNSNHADYQDMDLLRVVLSRSNWGPSVLLKSLR